MIWTMRLARLTLSLAWHICHSDGRTDAFAERVLTHITPQKYACSLFAYEICGTGAC